MSSAAGVNVDMDVCFDTSRNPYLQPFEMHLDETSHVFEKLLLDLEFASCMVVGIIEREMPAILVNERSMSMQPLESALNNLEDMLSLHISRVNDIDSQIGDRDHMLYWLINS